MLQNIIQFSFISIIAIITSIQSTVYEHLPTSLKTLKSTQHRSTKVQLSLNLHSVNFEVKIMKQTLIAIFVLAVSTSVFAACANREKNDDRSDIYEDIKCGLSTAGDKLKDGTTKALDVLSKAAVKTGSVFRDGLNVAVETGKSGFGIVRDAIKGIKTSEVSEGIDVRALKTDEP